MCVCVFVRAHVDSGQIYKGNGQTSFYCTFFLNYRTTFFKNLRRISIEA